METEKPALLKFFPTLTYVALMGIRDCMRGLTEDFKQSWNKKRRIQTLPFFLYGYHRVLFPLVPGVFCICIIRVEYKRPVKRGTIFSAIDSADIWDIHFLYVSPPSGLRRSPSMIKLLWGCDLRE